MKHVKRFLVIWIPTWRLRESRTRASPHTCLPGGWGACWIWDPWPTLHQKLSRVNDARWCRFWNSELSLSTLRSRRCCSSTDTKRMRSRSNVDLRFNAWMAAFQKLMLLLMTVDVIKAGNVNVQHWKGPRKKRILVFSVIGFYDLQSRHMSVCVCVGTRWLNTILWQK